MPVTVEVPKGCKWCKTCGEVKPVESGFFVRRWTEKRSGIERTYASTECRNCESRRRWANKRRAVIYGSSVSAGNPIKADTPKGAADYICTVAGDTDIIVFRRPDGMLAWERAGTSIPEQVELIGRYDHGADMRRVVQDIAA